MLNKPIKIRVGVEHFGGACRRHPTRCLLANATRDALGRAAAFSTSKARVGDILFDHDKEDIVLDFDYGRLTPENFGPDRYVTLTPNTFAAKAQSTEPAM